MLPEERNNRPMNQHGGPAGGRLDRMGRPGHPLHQRNADAQGLNEGMQNLDLYGPGRPNPNETRPAGNFMQHGPNQQGSDMPPPGFPPQNGGRLGDFVKLLNGDVVFVPPGLEAPGPYFVPNNQQNQQGYPPQAPTPVPIFSCPPPMPAGAMNPMPPGAMMGAMGPHPGAHSMRFPTEGPQSAMFGQPPDNWVHPMFLVGSGGPGVGPSSQDFQQASFPVNDDPQAEAVKNQLMHQFLCEQQREQQPGGQQQGPGAPPPNGPHQQGPGRFGQRGVDGSDVGAQVVSKVVDRMLYMLVPDTTKKVYRDMCTNFLVQPMMCPDWSAFIKLEEAAQLGLRGSFAVIAVENEGPGSVPQQNADASAMDGQNQEAKAPQAAQQPQVVINAVASAGQSRAETPGVAGKGVVAQSTMTPTAGPLSDLLPMGFAGNDAAKQFHVGLPGGKPEQQPPLMPRPPQVQVGLVPEGENFDRAAKIIHQIGRYVYATAHCCTYEPAICVMLHCHLRPLAEKMRWKHPALNGKHRCGDGSCAKFRPPIVRNLQPQPIYFAERSNNNSHDHRFRAEGRRSRVNSSSSSSGGGWMNGHGHANNHGNGHGRGDQKLDESVEGQGSDSSALVVLPVSKKYVDAVKTNVNGGDGDQQDARKNDVNDNNRNGNGKDNGGGRKKRPLQ